MQCQGRGRELRWMLSILTCSCSLCSSLARSWSLCSSRGPVSMIAAAPAHKICHFPLLRVQVCTFDKENKMTVGAPLENIVIQEISSLIIITIP